MTAIQTSRFVATSMGVKGMWMGSWVIWELRACCFVAAWLEACKPCPISDLQVLSCSGNQVPLIYGPRLDQCIGGPCGNFKFSSFGQLQVSFIAESLGFKVLFPTSCRAVFLSHVLPSPTLLACAPAVPWLSLLFLHAVPLLATLPPFVSTSLPSILPFHCLHPSQLTLYCHTPDFLKFWQVSKMGIGKPTYYYTLSSGKNPVTLSPPLSTIFLLFVLAALLPTLKLQTLWGQCQNLVWIL